MQGCGQKTRNEQGEQHRKKYLDCEGSDFSIISMIDEETQILTDNMACTQISGNVGWQN